MNNIKWHTRSGFLKVNTCFRGNYQRIRLVPVLLIEILKEAFVWQDVIRSLAWEASDQFLHQDQRSWLTSFFPRGTTFFLQHVLFHWYIYLLVAFPNCKDDVRNLSIKQINNWKQEINVKIKTLKDLTCDPMYRFDQEYSCWSESDLQSSKFR